MVKQLFKNWIIGIVLSPLLEDQQSENLGIMPQAWRSWPQETMKTCWRWDSGSDFVLHSHVQVVPSVFCSVLSLYLKDCYLNHMMRPLPLFCLHLLNGILWLSSECIPSHQLTGSGNVPPTSGISWGIFRHTYAVPSWPLPKEETAHGRWRAKKNATWSTHSTSQTAPKQPPKIKLFNLFTYKLHSLGDYVRMILWFRTLDSYSTQPVHTNNYPIPYQILHSRLI